MADSLVDQLVEQRRTVDYDTFDITVKELLNMLTEQNIDIAPVYQRHFRWDELRQSTYVESVFLGIPVPSLFMAANADGTWELVHGVQRVSTLVHFAGESALHEKLRLSAPLTLSGLEKLTTFNDKTFAELPVPLRLQFQLKPIKVVTISDKSDLQVRFDVFQRLNTGGIALSPQEIRACIHRGQFNDLLEELVRDPNFQAVVKLPRERLRDRTNEEYVLRFFAFLARYKQFEHSVSGFLNGYMREASRRFDYDAGEAAFRKTFKQLANLFPNGLKRRKGTTPVNLFEAVSVGAALALRRKLRLQSPKDKDWLRDPDFERATTAATNNRSQVLFRIEYCDRLFGG